MKADEKWVPIVFTMASAVGVVGTAVLTAKCTTKAEKILSQSRTKYGVTTIWYTEVSKFCQTI